MAQGARFARAGDEGGSLDRKSWHPRAAFPWAYVGDEQRPTDLDFRRATVPTAARHPAKAELLERSY